MAQGVELLDEAIDLARQEKQALEDGEYDDAIQLAEKRVELTGMAWNLLDAASRESFKKRLQVLSDFQKQLIELASKARLAIRNKMNQSKQERRRMNAYSMAVGQALQ